jgi:hypothetical protein
MDEILKSYSVFRTTICLRLETSPAQRCTGITLVAITPGLWETVGMEPSIRKLVFHKSQQFTEWACTVCEWAQRIPIKFGGDLPQNIETDFANHECAKYPRKLPTTRYAN